MALVVLWPQTLQVKATRIRLRGDFVNSDQGNVDTVSESAFAGRDGPSIPEPVVQPLTEAALNTNPMASSYDSEFHQIYLENQQSEFQKKKRWKRERDLHWREFDFGIEERG